MENDKQLQLWYYSYILDIQPRALLKEKHSQGYSKQCQNSPVLSKQSTNDSGGCRTKES